MKGTVAISHRHPKGYTQCVKCKPLRIWLRYAGFESFNANLYRQAAMAMARCERLEAIFFSDRIQTKAIATT